MESTDIRVLESEKMQKILIFHKLCRETENYNFSYKNRIFLQPTKKLSETVSIGFKKYIARTGDFQPGYYFSKSGNVTQNEF